MSTSLDGICHECAGHGLTSAKDGSANRNVELGIGMEQDTGEYDPTYGGTLDRVQNHCLAI